MEPAPQKILFVINPNSGAKTKQDYKAQIQEFFKSLPHTIEFHLLDDKNGAPTLLQSIEAFKPQKIAAVGGDGTVTMVAKEIIGTPMQMGIVPAGSANGMAKELAYPTAINDVLNVIVNGDVKSADVIKIDNNDICLHLSDIGLNARLIKYFEEGNMRGKLGYAKVALKVLWKRQQMQVAIQSTGKLLKRNAFMVVLANASKYGTGAVINPEGDLYDGLFEVVIIRRLAIFEILKMWFKPKPFNRKNIEVYKARSVHIVTNHKVHFQVDGEYKGKVKKVDAEVMPGQLNLILPKVS
jgi:diacylglycerol kinase (ATP)